MNGREGLERKSRRRRVYNVTVHFINGERLVLGGVLFSPLLRDSQFLIIYKGDKYYKFNEANFNYYEADFIDYCEDGEGISNERRNH